ncbi:MAG: carbon-nitrogen family hydrolase [Actinobacteria bacterium]|nr:carbon-nitrogen family hydrolase [Actinomycetota bacterium]
MRVAAIQHDIHWQDAARTREHVTPLIAQAVAAGTRLAVLTEMFATGFSMDPTRVAEPEGGPTESFLLERARAHDMWLIASVAQWGADGRARNNAIVAGPGGQVHRYAKIHPFSFAGEHEHYAAGTEHLTVVIDGMRVSVLVCYDLRFADEFWALARQTDLYVVPASWPAARREHWRTLLRARAIENQAYVVGANRVGRVVEAGQEIDHVGDSAIIDPLGRVIAEASLAQAVLVADVEATEVRDVRARYPFLADRR